jgi:hypothetical protein
VATRQGTAERWAAEFCGGDGAAGIAAAQETGEIRGGVSGAAEIPSEARKNATGAADDFARSRAEASEADEAATGPDEAATGATRNLV